MKKEGFISFIGTIVFYTCLLVGLIVHVNVVVDAASVIKPEYARIAELALAGNIISTPDNYNERVYQINIVNQMKAEPETIVIGSSRGFYLGEDITGYHNIYNNCVSGACLEDYYALLGLYENKFGKMPERVIMEVSPWIFYSGNSENRWQEDDTYAESAGRFYEIVNGKRLIEDKKTGIQKKGQDIENPYFSVPYFRYNIDEWVKNGERVFEKEHISIDKNEAAEYPDGTIRYSSDLENENEKRLKNVKSKKGACKYKNSHRMTEVDSKKAKEFEALIDYLKRNDTDIIIYMQPFSRTQSKYSFKKNKNPGYILAYKYLVKTASEKEIVIYGGYDARDYGLGDERFIDYMHPDKKGTDIVWKYGPGSF